MFFNKIYYNIYIIMSQIRIDHVKAYAEKNKISYKQALKDASPSYKTRNEKKPEEPKIETPLEKEKPKRKSNKKVVATLIMVNMVIS